MKQKDIEARFIKALHGLKKLNVIFYSKEDVERLVRICAPMDIGPSSRAKDKSPRYHFWDYSSDAGGHTLSLLPNQVIAIEILPEPFAPEEFVKWIPNWKIKRDWGEFS